ncbi:MAG: cupin domain-containing protein [Butyrivibrio sp.]|jgi:mannose-1-phosphate guanylyltransferase|uniref:sugar phosphate nucleotidyltransferase n=1 Tax=Butyrivibrio sp. TaxID=28121 RepID=UPI001EB4BA0E|nr:sugar phosphate nucleotidyltransferase [Butyrivibrio sp.]MBE5841955.1 cupin domain-containing protein [Butyrivibrio sp.]
MNIVLLSGGSGKRLWPLSNDVRSKQFIKMFHPIEDNADGNAANSDTDNLESMVQRVYGQIKRADANATVTIATSKSQVSAIHNQLGDKVSVCVEPTRRDTFPAIALAAAFLQDKLHVSRDEAVIICPVDPYVDDSYFDCFNELEKMVKSGDYNLNLMGVEPTYPSEKYGYIQPEKPEHISKVSAFKEKPDVETAQKYIDEGALWNCGVFAFKLGYIIDRAHELIDFKDYQDLFDHYEDCKKISFDYAVGEHETSIGVVRYSGSWKDIGSWNTFAEEMHENMIGKGEMDEECVNSNVVNELNIPIIAMGLKDMVVAASNDGILVADKGRSSFIKPYVERLTQHIRYAEKSWGSFTVVDVQPEALVIRVVLLPDHRLHYHSHEHRDEVWTVMSGEGTVILDDVKKDVKAGDVISIKVGQKHTVIAKTELVLNEVQVGKEISVEDKIKYDFPV